MAPVASWAAAHIGLRSMCTQPLLHHPSTRAGYAGRWRGGAYRRLMPEQTSAADALIVIFRALAPEEQDAALQRMSELRALRRAGQGTVEERMLRSMLVVSDYVRDTPGTLSPQKYRQARRELKAQGFDVEELTRITRHYGSWRRAKEALALAPTTEVQRIESRFRYRRLGKVACYSEETMRNALDQAVEFCGRVPLRSEFEQWRRRELELARAKGDDALQLPCAATYTRRWRTWESALLHYGYTPDEVAERLDGLTPAWNRGLTPRPLPEGTVVAELDSDAASELTGPEDRALRHAWQELPESWRYVLTVRLGLGCQRLTLAETAAPLDLHLSRAAQIQHAATRELCTALNGATGTVVAEPLQRRAELECALHALAVAPTLAAR